MVHRYFFGVLCILYLLLCYIYYDSINYNMGITMPVGPLLSYYIHCMGHHQQGWILCWRKRVKNTKLQIIQRKTLKELVRLAITSQECQLRMCSTEQKRRAKYTTKGLAWGMWRSVTLFSSNLVAIFNQKKMLQFFVNKRQFSVH